MCVTSFVSDHYINKWNDHNKGLGLIPDIASIPSYLKHVEIETLDENMLK